jgi:YebC/PmpR family DNA-binding regulatory protein
MAGHSHAKTIKHRKNGQDAKRSKIFTKIQREIFTAVKLSGADEKFNPKLRLARQKARLCNMPNDKIQDAIKRASSSDSNASNYEECYYLISLSGGIFILAKALTDNKNRSASETRGVVNRYAGSIAESSAIDFLFENVGVVKYKKQEGLFDKIFDKAIESGANDVVETHIIEEKEDEEILHPAIEVLCDFKELNAVKSALEKTFGEAEISEQDFRPRNKIEISQEQMEKVEKLTEELEELDDISMLYKNFD